MTVNITKMKCYCNSNNCEIIIFRSLTFVSESTPKIKSIGPLITEKRSFKKWKILPTFARFISKIKKPDIFNFPSIKYFVKRFLFLKILNVKGQLLWKLRAVELAIVEITGRRTCYFVSLDIT